MAKAISEARMREIFESVKSWGRWGKDDQAGALNLITPEKRRAAAALVRAGHAVSLARELPVQPSAENPNPALHMMVVGGDSCGPEAHGVEGLETTMDFVGVSFHGMAVSHIDALCHVAVNGQMYNGFPVTDVKSIGAMRNSILAAKDGIVSRGVLLDVARGLVGPLDPGEADGFIVLGFHRHVEIGLFAARHRVSPGLAAGPSAVSPADRRPFGGEGFPLVFLRRRHGGDKSTIRQ